MLCFNPQSVLQVHKRTGNYQISNLRSKYTRRQHNRQMETQTCIYRQIADAQSHCAKSCKNTFFLKLSCFRLVPCEAEPFTGLLWHRGAAMLHKEKSKCIHAANACISELKDEENVEVLSCIDKERAITSLTYSQGSSSDFWLQPLTLMIRPVFKPSPLPSALTHT